MLGYVNYNKWTTGGGVVLTVGKAIHVERQVGRGTQCIFCSTLL